MTGSIMLDIARERKYRVCVYFSDHPSQHVHAYLRIIMKNKNNKAAEIKAIWFNETFIALLLDNLPDVEIKTVAVEIPIKLAAWKDLNQIVLLDFNNYLEKTYKILDIDYYILFVCVLSPLAFSESKTKI
jgi:hypothetical protein